MKEKSWETETKNRPDFFLIVILKEQITQLTRSSQPAPSFLPPSLENGYLNIDDPRRPRRICPNRQDPAIPPIDPRPRRRTLPSLRVRRPILHLFRLFIPTTTTTSRTGGTTNPQTTAGCAHVTVRDSDEVAASV